MLRSDGSALLRCRLYVFACRFMWWVVNTALGIYIVISGNRFWTISMLEAALEAKGATHAVSRYLLILQPETSDPESTPDPIPTPA